MRPTRSFYFLMVLCAVLLVLKVGCVAINVSSWSASEAQFKESRTMAAPSASAIVVRTGNGAVSVRRGDSADTTIVADLRATTKERLADTHVIAERQADGSLLVTVAWPGGHALNNEGCSFDIAVPASTGATTVNTSNGSITLTSLSGTARLDTSNGAVKVTDQQGPAHVRTSNGSVVLTRVTGDADAETSNGRIEMTDAAGRVVARTSNGSVKVALAGGSSGSVEVGTSNGSAELVLPRTYAGRVSLSTSNGSLHYPSGPAVHDLSASKTHATMALGDGAATSTVTTSNGSIDVRVAE